MNQGSVIIYYGNGKGKSSSAIGHAICAAGMGESVAIIQFLKGNNHTEIDFLKRLVFKALHWGRDTTCTVDKLFGALIEVYLHNRTRA